MDAPLSSLNPLPSLAEIQVLVVDDDQDTRDLVELVLTSAGTSVVVASSAKDAVRALDDIDIVVTDYSMPGETGFGYWNVSASVPSQSR